MEAKHTPGSWVLDFGSVWDKDNPPITGFAIGSAELGFSTVTIRADGQIMTPCPTVEKLKEIGLANARLMASSPELLEALRDAEFLLRKAAQSAGPMQDSFNRSAEDARATIAKATGLEV